MRIKYQNCDQQLPQLILRKT